MILDHLLEVDDDEELREIVRKQCPKLKKALKLKGIKLNKLTGIKLNRGGSLSKKDVRVILKISKKLRGESYVAPSKGKKLREAAFLRSIKVVELLKNIYSKNNEVSKKDVVHIIEISKKMREEEYHA